MNCTRALEESLMMNKFAVILILSLLPILGYSQYSIPKKINVNKEVKSPLPTIKEISSISGLEWQDKYNSKRTYMPSLGFMCLLEVNMNKKAHVPLNIRLGSKEYVDKLENK